MHAARAQRRYILMLLALVAVAVGATTIRRSGAISDKAASRASRRAEESLERRLSSGATSLEEKRLAALELGCAPQFFDVRSQTPRNLSPLEQRRVRRLQILASGLPDARRLPDSRVDERIAYCLFMIDAFVDPIERVDPEDESRAAVESRLAAYRRLRFLAPLTASNAPTAEPSAESDATSPVDAEGAPLFFTTPSAFETSRCDGERVAALLRECETALGVDFGDPTTLRAVARAHPRALRGLIARKARLAQDAFGVASLDAKSRAELESTLEVARLDDDETVVRLRDGLRVVALPLEYDFLRLWSIDKDLFGYNLRTQKALERELRARGQTTRLAALYRENLEAEAEADFEIAASNVGFFAPSSREDFEERRLRAVDAWKQKLNELTSRR